MSEAIIFCEGYYDRAFWDGWLGFIGCTSLFQKSGIPVVDPFSEEVRGGQFAYHSRNRAFIRVIPCKGKEKVLPAAIARLKQRTTKPLTRLVINIDSDKNADGTPCTTTVISHKTIADRLRQLDSSTQETADGNFLMDNGATEVALIRWEASDAATPCLPNQQTLERLVCSALVAAYPDRGPCVQNWLDSRLNAPTAGPKEFAFSHMAGWFAEFVYEGFYSSLWRDAGVAAELKARLEASGAWRVAEAMANA